MNETITISTERYNQLIRAEQDANHLKALIAGSYENYDSFGREEICLLYRLYFGKKEGGNV